MALFEKHNLAMPGGQGKQGGAKRQRPAARAAAAAAAPGTAAAEEQQREILVGEKVDVVVGDGWVKAKMVVKVHAGPSFVVCPPPLSCSVPLDVPTAISLASRITP